MTKIRLLVPIFVFSLLSITASANGEPSAKKAPPTPPEASSAPESPKTPQASNPPKAPTPPETTNGEVSPPEEPAIPEVADTAPAAPPAPETESDSSALDDTSQTAETTSKGSIARSIVTSGIEKREPTDNLNQIPNTMNKVFYFSELMDLKGEKITHRWLYNDKVQAEVNFNVGGKRWRVYSSKNLRPSWTGTWTVQVALADGTVLETKSFDLIESSEETRTETVGQLQEG